MNNAPKRIKINPVVLRTKKVNYFVLMKKSIYFEFQS